jgi:hypothetical protein
MEILRKIGRENRKTNEPGFQELAAILSPLGLYGGNRTSKIPHSNNYGYKTLKGGFGRLESFSIGQMPGGRNLLSLDASLAIPTCVLRFEDSGLCLRTPVRPVLLTGQIGTHRSDRSNTPVRQVWHCCSTIFGSSVLALANSV